MLRKLKSPARCTDSTQISVANTCVHKVNQLRLLGVVVSDTLSWNSHTAATCKKVCSMLGALCCSTSVTYMMCAHQAKNELLSSCVGQLT